MCRPLEKEMSLHLRNWCKIKNSTFLQLKERLNKAEQLNINYYTLKAALTLGARKISWQKDVADVVFSDVEIIFNKLLRHCPGPGECSAHRFMVIRHEEKNGAAKTEPHGKVENRL